MKKNNPLLPVDRKQTDPSAGDMMMKAIAHIRSDFPQKFGIPRQSGLVKELTARIFFAPEFRKEQAIRGLEGYSHIWLIWQFSQARTNAWTPMVRPPKLGGDAYMGVFATRSPCRPNPIGLSCVKLERVETGGADGPVLVVSGADLMDGTPIYDIKPYLAYADSYPEAAGGFTDEIDRSPLKVVFPEELLQFLPEEKRASAKGVLAQDPRPSYQDDPDRTYGIFFAGFNLKFQVCGRILTVTEVNAQENSDFTVSKLTEKASKID